MMTRSVLCLLVPTLVSLSCVRQKRPVIEPEPSTQVPADLADPIVQVNGDADESQNSTKIPEADDSQTQSTLPLVFEKRSFAPYARDLENLKYKFSYLAKKEEGDLTFTDNKAKLNIKGLKHGEKGSLILEIYEGVVLKLKGELKDLELKQGSNAVKIILNPVDSGSTDLTINVTLEEEDPDSGNDTGDGPTQLTYVDVKSIIERKCVRCHTGSAVKPELGIYPYSSEAQENSRIVDAVIRTSKSGSMPKSGEKVTTQEVAKIEKWKQDGLKP
jgi:hypothetical protein